MLSALNAEYLRYKAIGEKAISQTSDAGLNALVGADNNSIAIIIRHISGNLASRFTDFLTSDGEKPWRNRETEFEVREYSRAEVEEMWQQGWAVLLQALDGLTDDDLKREVTIRGVGLTVADALARSLSHLAYHVGQIVTLARIVSEDGWKWISIPRGGSEAYNRNPTFEKKLG